MAKKTAGGTPSASKAKPKKVTVQKSELQQGDFTKLLGIVPLAFKRPVKVKEKTVDITVLLKMNNNKKTFEISNTLKWSHLTGEKKTDSATMELLNDLTHKAIAVGMEWLKKVREENPTDPDQLDLDF